MGVEVPLVEGGADRMKNPATAATIRIPTTAPTITVLLAARRRVMALRKQLDADTVSCADIGLLLE